MKNLVEHIYMETETFITEMNRLFKKWLEFEFISDDEFISLLNDRFNVELLIEFKLKTKEERVIHIGNLFDTIFVITK